MSRLPIRVALIVSAAMGCVPAFEHTATVLPGAAPLCVGVLPFENHSGVDRAGEVVAAHAAGELVTSGHYSVLEPLEARRILDAFELTGDVPTDREALQKFGALLGVEALLVGSVARYRDRPTSGSDKDEPLVSYSSRLVDVVSGDTLWASTSSGRDAQVLLGLPRSRSLVARDTVAASMAPVAAAGALRFAPREICWKPLLEPALPGDDAGLDPERFVEIIARGGETLETIAERYYLNPGRLELISGANPGVTPTQELTAGTRVLVPRYVVHATTGQDSLADVAARHLGDAAYSPLVYWNNRGALGGDVPGSEQAARYGVITDARQRWSLFEVLGSTRDMYVVVNGVPRVFPRAQCRLRWLVYGRKLPLKGGLPVEDAQFETALENADKVTAWRIEIRDSEHRVVRTLAGDGLPPPIVSWDGRLDGKAKLVDGASYEYQLHVTYEDGATIDSALEAFGAGVKVAAPRVAPQASIAGRALAVTESRFSERFSAETMGGRLEVKLVGADGGAASGLFPVPTVAIVRPTKLEILEVGVDNDVYRFPPVPVVGGRVDLAALDQSVLTFQMSARTEPTNTIVIDGQPVTVAATGEFQARLELRRGKNVFSMLARSPEGSQTFVEEEIVLRTRGPDGEPWEFSASLPAGASTAQDKLPGGVTLKVPLLRMPLSRDAGVREALFGKAAAKDNR